MSNLKKRHYFKAILVFAFFYNIFLNAQNPDYKSNLDFYLKKMEMYSYTNKDSAYFYFNKTKKIANENNDVRTLLDVLINENWSANYYYDLSKVKKNLSDLDQVLKKHKTFLETIPEKKNYINSIKYSKALHSFELKDYNKSLDIFTALTKDIEATPNFISDDNAFGFYVSAKNFIGKINYDEGRYDLAESFHNESLRILNSRPESFPAYKNTTYLMLSKIYIKDKNYRKANSTILKTFDYYTNTTKKSNQIISSYQGIVENHIHLKQIDSAQFYLSKMIPYLSENHPLWDNYYISQSNILKAQKNYKPASKALEKALQLVKQKWNNKPHNDIAEVYNRIGNLYSESSNPNRAIVNYNLAIQQFENDTLNSVINKTTLFTSLKQKAKALNEIKKFDLAIEISEKAFATLNILKPTFKNNNDKLFLIENAFPVFEYGLDALFNLYTTSKDTSLIDKAFSYSEQSKSALLLEALLSAKATEYGDIPEDIIEKEKILKSKITHLEKKLIRKKTDALENEIFHTKIQYKNLVENLETNYKNYYNLKYNINVISSENIQEQLKEDELLVSYFFGISSIYGIAIGKETKQFIKIPVDDNLKHNLINFQKNISKPKSNIEILSKQSYQLYDELLIPLLKDSSAKNLIIIPDGLLNYIPFSSFNTQENSTKYLIEDYSVNYINSATLLNQLQKQYKNNKEVLAFAPTFNAHNNKLLPLPNNKREVDNLLRHIGGKSFVNDEASLQNFNKESKNYNIIHLATHAIFNDDNPEYSFLAFSSKKDNENLLYIKDLYNLNLNANLITLSACESGIGDLKRGEGLMSLARGFYFSGAKSIASTLWKITDTSSSKLMDDFYFNLSKGKHKPIALQKAQINFINNNKENALSHPYYWSGFVVSGNTAPLMEITNYWLWGIGCLIIIILLTVLFLRYKKSLKFF